MFVVKNKSNFKLEYVYDGKKGFIDPKKAINIGDVSKFKTNFQKFIHIQPVIERKSKEVKSEESKQEEVKNKESKQEEVNENEIKKEEKKKTIKRRATRRKKMKDDNQGDKDG